MDASKDATTSRMSVCILIRLMKKLLGLVITLSVALSAFAQINLQDTVRSEDDTIRSANSGFAEEEFRRGVQSFYRGNYNESILEFEKAFSFCQKCFFLVDGYFIGADDNL